MSQEAVEKVLGRLLTDDQFRQYAAVSLEEVCIQQGYPLSPAELKLLSKMDLGLLVQAAEGVDSCLRREECICVGNNYGGIPAIV